MKPEIVFHDDGGAFVVETRAPAGYELGQHEHDVSHLSFLASGRARVTVDGIGVNYVGPCMLTIAANKAHKVLALTPIVWLCIWGDFPGVKEAAADSLRLLEGA